MELQEQLTATKSERDQYKKMCESINAEKVALDQMFVEQLRVSLNHKKDLILQQGTIQNHIDEISGLKNTINELNNKLIEVSELHCVHDLALKKSLDAA